MRYGTFPFFSRAARGFWSCNACQSIYIAVLRRFCRPTLIDSLRPNSFAFCAADGANRLRKSPRDRLHSRPERSGWCLRSYGVFLSGARCATYSRPGTRSHRTGSSAPLLSPSLTENFTTEHQSPPKSPGRRPVRSRWFEAATETFSSRILLADYHSSPRRVSNETSNSEPRTSLGLLESL